MKSLTERVAGVLAWRSNQPAVIRWLQAVGLFFLALLLRFALGDLHGATVGLAFYPSILLIALLIGWREALLVLALSVSAGIYLFLPDKMYLQPIGWVIIGGLNIAIIAMLKNVAQELSVANERQQLLFQELQHRVANTLQSVVGSLEGARRQVETAPQEAARRLDEAIQRIAASADVHRRLNDPTLFVRELGSILQDAVSSVIDRHRVVLTFDIAPLDLSFDQMSNITMLVTEVANNAQKHVFQFGFGTHFAVALKAVSAGRAMLVIRDDGPGIAGSSGAADVDPRLGFKVIRALAQQLGGRLTITPGQGTEIVVEFPFGRPKDRLRITGRHTAPAPAITTYVPAKPRSDATPTSAGGWPVL
jgi:two-component sensor histidine kinase